MEVINAMRYRIFILFFLLAIGLMRVSGLAAQETKGLVVSPEVIDVDSFFSGSGLTISGDIKAADDVIIEITGKDGTNNFELKGRVGPFWMTTGKVELKNIPSFYLVLLPQGKDWLRKADAMGLGMDQIRRRMVTSSTAQVPENIFDMFKKLKKSEELYDEIIGAVTYGKAVDGMKHFVGKCNVPSSIALGSYLVKATVVTGGAAGQELQSQLKVQEIGFVKFVNSLASDRRITYGVSAVIIALAAGLLMGVLFRKSGGSH
jgi:Putative transmembrane protein (Alph_Pro_TM)